MKASKSVKGMLEIKRFLKHVRNYGPECVEKDYLDLTAMWLSGYVHGGLYLDKEAVKDYYRVMWRATNMLEQWYTSSLKPDPFFDLGPIREYIKKHI